MLDWISAIVSFAHCTVQKPEVVPTVVTSVAISEVKKNIEAAKSGRI